MIQQVETKEVTKEMRDKLKAPLPPESIKPHPTKTYLSSIKPIYVTERMNDVFGVGAWQIRAELVQLGEKGTVVTKTTLDIPAYGIHYESFGGNDNGGEDSKNFDLGDAFKGATTDGLTKICSYMEIGIDVFKGKSTPAVKVQNQTEIKPPSSKELPWLNEGTKEYQTVKEELASGKTTLEVVKKSFRVSKASETKLKA